MDSKSDLMSTVNNQGVRFKETTATLRVVSEEKLVGLCYSFSTALPRLESIPHRPTSAVSPSHPCRP